MFGAHLGLWSQGSLPQRGPFHRLLSEASLNFGGWIQRPAIPRGQKVKAVHLPRLVPRKGHKPYSISPAAIGHRFKKGRTQGHTHLSMGSMSKNCRVMLSNYKSLPSGSHMIDILLICKIHSPSQDPHYSIKLLLVLHCFYLFRPSWYSTKQFSYKHCGFCINQIGVVLFNKSPNCNNKSFPWAPGEAAMIQPPLTILRSLCF